MSNGKLEAYLMTVKVNDLTYTGINNIGIRFNAPIQDIHKIIAKIKGEVEEMPLIKRKKKPKTPIKKTYIEYDKAFVASSETNGLRFLNHLALVEKRKNTDWGKWDKIQLQAYTDNSANELTKSIIKFVELIGGQAERINSTGKVIDKRTFVKDDFGNTKVIGSMKWIKASTTLGTSDISIIINGLSVKCEVKFGKDVQSDRQKKYQEQIEQAGGIYIIAKTFQGFYNWFNSKFGNDGN
jgi:hypothetical protein